MAQLGDLIVSGKARFLNEINGQIDWSNVLSKPTIPTVTDTYSATGTAATSGKAVAAALGTLNISLTGVPGSSNTLTAFSQINGKVNATFGSISITKSQISDFPTSMTPTSHTHGNIQNGGTLQTNDITIASGDKLVVTDSSDSSKLARTSISFDGSTTTQCLTKKGTWATFGTSNLTIGTTATTAMAGNTAVNKVLQTESSDNAKYPILFSNTARTIASDVTDTARKSVSLFYNPNTQKINIGGDDSVDHGSISRSKLEFYDSDWTSELTAKYFSTKEETGAITYHSHLGSDCWVISSTTATTEDSLYVYYNDIELTGRGTWDGTNTSLKTAISSIPKVKVADYTFTFPSSATAYYEHYYYDVTYSNLNIPTTGITIINAFVANVGNNIPAFAQCVAPSAFRVYSRYADIKGKTITMRVIYI